jgi:hypothetical protein
MQKANFILDHLKNDVHQEMSSRAIYYGDDEIRHTVVAQSEMVVSRCHL